MGVWHFLDKLLSGVALSSLSLVLISSSAYSMCVPPNLPKCKCQFPVFDGNELKCGDSYCKDGKECMDDGSCCTTLDKDGSNCCDKTGKHKETGLCCDVLTQEDCSTGIIDNQTTGCKECCPALETAGCETETAENGCTVCKVAENSCDEKERPCTNGTNTWCCAEGNTCQDGKCCHGDTCCDVGEFVYGYYTQDCIEDPYCTEESQSYFCCDGSPVIGSGLWRACCPKGYFVVSCDEYCQSKGYAEGDFAPEQCVDSNGDAITEYVSNCECY